MSRKILIVNDEPDTLKTFADLFESEGYEVTCAATGEQALTSINGHRPDVILLDFMLTGRTELEVARELAHRDDDERVPIVMITALTDFMPGEKSLVDLTGLKRFIFKPCKPKTLLKVVDDTIRYDL